MIRVGRLPAPDELPAPAPGNASGVLARIRTEQRRLEWLLEGCERPHMPERVLTLLEDALLGLREAGDQLEHVMPAGAIACGCSAFPYPHTRAGCSFVVAREAGT